MIKELCLAINLAGLSLYAGVSGAYVNQISGESDILTQNRLVEIQVTRGMADGIWNKLTSEFVTLFESGQYAQAAATAKAAYSLAEKSFGPEDVNTADSMLKLGIISETLGDYAEAREHLLGALVILENALGGDHEDIAVVLTNLANVYYEQNMLEESEKYHLRALGIRVRALGEDDVAVAQSQYNLAVLYDDAGDYAKAKQLYESAINIWNASFGPVHPYIANALNNLANVHIATNEPDIAIELHTHSLAVRRALYGNQHAEVARSLINLGALYVKNNTYEKAKPLYIEAVGLAENIFGNNHPQVAMLLYSLANIYHIQGRMQESHAQQYQGEDIKVSLIEKAQRSNTSETDHAAADQYFEKALPLYERALRILDTELGSGHPAISAMLNEMAMLYKSMGNNRKADQMLARLSHTE